jgi:hypothetical protein
MLFEILFSSTCNCMFVVPNCWARGCSSFSQQSVPPVPFTVGHMQRKVGPGADKILLENLQASPLHSCAKITTSSLYNNDPLQKRRPILCVLIDDRHMPNRNNGAANRQQHRVDNYNWCHSRRRCHETTAHHSRCTCLRVAVMIALHIMIGSVCQRMDQFFAASRALALPRLGAASGEQPAPSP